MKFAMDNDGIGDDPDDFDDWLVQNIEEQLDEGKNGFIYTYVQCNHENGFTPIDEKT